MLKKYINYLRQVLPLMKNSWLPAGILLAVSCLFMLLSPFPEVVQNILHTTFYVITISNIAILMFYNRNRPMFFVIVMLISYMLINYLKFYHGVIYYLTPDYANLVFLSVAGLIFFYFLPDRPLFSTDTVYFLIIVFAALSLGEFLSSVQIKIDFSPLINFGCGLQIFALVLFGIMIITMLLHASIKDQILDASMAYASVCIMVGFYTSNQPSALSLFFTAAALILFIATCRHIFFILRKDPDTGLNNAHSFLVKAKKLPLKYGLGIICIDEYRHLLQAFRKNGINNLMAMVSKKITSIEPEAMLFRCTPDEFVIIFPQAEKGTSYDRLDEIRRQIAASEFILPRIKKPIKITVSCSIADKKRSDGNVSDVFIRAHRALQKTYKFTQNITSKA